MDIDSHIDSLPEPRRDIVRAVHDTIRAAAPDLEATMWSEKIIGYGSYHYRYASGREGDWFPVGLANQKQYVSLYICAADEDGYLAEQNADRLGNVSVGKSCIRFKRLEDLDLNVVAELTRRAADLVSAGRFAM
jgi:Domain of unknown function (DU1801)